MADAEAGEFWALFASLLFQRSHLQRIVGKRVKLLLNCYGNSLPLFPCPQNISILVINKNNNLLFKLYLF
jgi:hypothetical protein